jgi:hypothetical protein
LLRDNTPQERDAMVASAKRVVEDLLELERLWRLTYGVEALRKWQVWVLDHPAATLTADILVYSNIDEFLHCASSPPDGRHAEHFMFICADRIKTLP